MPILPVVLSMDDNGSTIMSLIVDGYMGSNLTILRFGLSLLLQFIIF